MNKIHKKIILKENTRYRVDREIVEDGIIIYDKDKDEGLKISNHHFELFQKLSFKNIRSIKQSYNLIWINENEKVYKKEKIIEFESDNSFWVKNFIGILKLKNENSTILLEIGTRFDKEKKYNFLQAMLESYFAGGVQKSPSVPQDNVNILDILLIYIYANKLKLAYQKGLLKIYQNKKYNDYNLKGKIDFSRHIKGNTPFMGKVAYNKREHSYDNPIMWLVLQAYDYINARYSQVWNDVYGKDTVIKEAIRIINENTPSYYSSMNLINNKEANKKVAHPYYKEYEELRKISIDIIKRNGLSVYGQDKEEISGILVYVPTLWEKFLFNEVFNKIKIKPEIKEQEKIKVLKKTQDEKIKYFYSNYIDFYIKFNDRKYILDAKYSAKWNGENYDKDAIRQVVNYIHLTNANVGGVIC
ncbi:MAG: 5-methylcytosine restriction system specificity protein McrC, partial [bacterium]